MVTRSLALLLYALLLTHVGINVSTYKHLMFLSKLECLEGLAGHWAKILDLNLSLLVNLGIAHSSTDIIPNITAGELNEIFILSFFGNYFHIKRLGLVFAAPLLLSIVSEEGEGNWMILNPP